jgi:hypothetical protein
VPVPRSAAGTILGVYVKGLWLMVCAASMVAAMPVRASDFKDTQFGYSVSPPEFSAPPAGGMFPRLNVLAPPEDGFSANMGVMIQEVRITRDQYIALNEEQFRAAGMTVRKSSKRDVSGQPAVLVDYEGPMRGRNLRFLSLAVILPERVLLLTYTAPASSFGGLEKEFRRSLETFKLTPR